MQSALALFGNLGMTEMLLILIVAILIFGKDLPQAASKAYLQARKLRNAVDDLRRESGIDQEIRNIERTVREAEWEARRTETRGSEPRKLTPAPPVSQVPRPKPAPAVESASAAEPTVVAPPPPEPTDGAAS
jgi:Sec-independent protein translocase protein TatA